LELMDELVFEPLGMNATAAESPETMDRLVEFYNTDGGRFGTTRDVDLSVKWAGGGFVSTPTDLVTLGASLLSDRLISSETREEFFAVQPMFDGSENPQVYALGWRHHETVNILGEDTPVDAVHHGGTSEGGVAFLLLVPDHEISIAFLTNGAGDSTRVEIQRLAYRIAGLAIQAQLDRIASPAPGNLIGSTQPNPLAQQDDDNDD
ncbi:MAG: serine hydrolase domain-containing protein, partial [Kiloniellales bacterium]|nr:serine hydrolase domain-containing protein [Kiloniellales bacterium]